MSSRCVLRRADRRLQLFSQLSALGCPATGLMPMPVSTLSTSLNNLDQGRVQPSGVPEATSVHRFCHPVHIPSSPHISQEFPSSPQHSKVTPALLVHHVHCPSRLMCSAKNSEVSRLPPLDDLPRRPDVEGQTLIQTWVVCGQDKNL